MYKLVITQQHFDTIVKHSQSFEFFENIQSAKNRACEISKKELLWWDDVNKFSIANDVENGFEFFIEFYY